MNFYTAIGLERPKRLKEKTRKFAYESMQGKYGDMAMESFAVTLDHIEGFDKLSPIKRYDLAIKEIALKAPIRVCQDELVHGSASLGLAIHHTLPAQYRGQSVFPSISHLTLGFDKVVYNGIDSHEEKIKDKLKEDGLNKEEVDFLESLQNVIDSMRIWHARYKEVIPELSLVPFTKAMNFKEAVQSLWFTFAFTRLTGNWPGIGRIDRILGDYLKEDLSKGTICLDEARDLLASFFIKGCEWIRGKTPLGSGDSQHYQNIVLAGLDENGIEVTNEVTYLVLDIIEELGISDFPITVRVNENTDPKLLDKIAMVMRHGGGVLAVYNESLVLRALQDQGYPYQEALKFANDGCWEVQIPGETYFIYAPFDSLSILLNDSLGLGKEHRTYESFDDLYEEYKKNLRIHVSNIVNGTINGRLEKVDGKWKNKPVFPNSVVSLFTKDCIQKAASYLEGGARYTVVSPHIGGGPDTGNSLYAIKKLVYEDKLVSLEDLLNILEDNWEGNEILRQRVRSKYYYYGNDLEADDYTVKVMDDFADIVISLNDESVPIKFPAGISTFGRQIDWAPIRPANPFGYRKGAILSGNASPTPGTDFEGATATIKSYCKIDHTKQGSGSALDLKLHPSSVKGDNGILALVSLIRGFVELGGFFMQIDVIDAKALKRAQENPQEYKTLSVRVSGWNARFVTLNKEWQDMIIERTAQGL